MTSSPGYYKTEKTGKRGEIERSGVLARIEVRRFQPINTRVTWSRRSNGVLLSVKTLALVSASTYRMYLRWGDYDPCYIAFETDPPVRVRVRAVFSIRSAKFKELNMASSPRPLHEIAKEIQREWRCPAPMVVPYIESMLQMEDAWSRYNGDGGSTVITYFLRHSYFWRGTVADRIKAELTAVRAMPKVIRETEEKMG